MRDNATHHFAASAVLAKKISEISGATVRNFVNVARSWFKVDFSEHFTLGMPLAFVTGQSQMSAVVTGGERKNLSPTWTN